ncbi:hypothetical protein AU184_06045 [Mycolicibacterium novocastrense]|uniref:hypothetical protein n=1 Tax=Mycolicibacterium novocastrense TaxID=59813 RepID=UPI00074AFBE6|nr:hypothetical protein [Mycolicibacterium novocastrense]KUH65782.1 hypothetical protein AU072_06400 [Mycolicibacterium novocastrense]KUH65990.1 hypothetical protein AU183_14925 [Mycolicibacterium novocastrense]KUH67229.1 hypothetical protein AU184_06045 [Mycolicibacterium novocastrense]
MSETSQRPRGSIVSVLALVVALVALGIAIWAATKAPSSQSGSAQQGSVFTGATTDDPKASICEAFNIVRNGVQLNTNLKAPGGPADGTGTLAVAANARLSLSEGGQYLLARLQPDTPSELADAVRKFANQLMDIGARSIAGTANADPDQAARLKDADESSASIINLCK